MISFFSLGKFVSPEMVARRVAKSGDGTHPLHQQLQKQQQHEHEHQHTDCIWGYGDADICPADLKELQQMDT